MKAAAMDKLDAFQSEHENYYWTLMTNNDQNKMCNWFYLSRIVVQLKWSMFFHVLGQKKHLRENHWDLLL